MVIAADAAVGAGGKYVFEIDKAVDVSVSGISEALKGDTVPVDSIGAAQDLTAIEQITHLQIELVALDVEGKDRRIDLFSRRRR